MRLLHPLPASPQGVLMVPGTSALCAAVRR